MPAPVPSLLVALALAFAPTSRGAGPLPVPVDTTALQRLLQAEDARGTGPDGLVPLLASLRGRDTLPRRVAVRGLGRLQQPGGGTDANEYVGDASFMRDELTLRMHARGTLGISARGRDTGDGQWFLNLVDNPCWTTSSPCSGESMKAGLWPNGCWRAIGSPES